jgi:CDP-L-myo-inositol myo-inositolphosphotransferase
LLGQPVDRPAGERIPGLHVRPAVAVMLAAGRSERLSTVTGGSSKALVNLAGLPLVERALLRLLAAGVQRIVLVVGHDAERVAEVAEAVAPGRVEVVQAGGWEAGNGASLAAAEDSVAGEHLFLLLTVDHLFGSAALEQLLEAGRPAVLVDAHPADTVLAEGTRVAVADGLAQAFGKEIDSGCVDCGAFVVPPRIFQCQREAAAAGDFSLAGALTCLASREPMLIVPVPPESWWLDVDTPADLQAARLRLRRSLAKPTDGLVSRVLNRPLSTRVSMLLAPLRPAPDLVTVLVFGLSLVGAAALGAGAGVVGGLLVQLSSVLDGVDGELARLQMGGSSRGALLDSVLDRIGDASILVAVGAWALSAFPAREVLVLTGAAVTGAFLSMALKDRAQALRLPPLPERVLGMLLGGRDGRLFLVAVFAVLGQPLLALVAVALTSALTAGVRLWLHWSVKAV